VGRKSDFTAVAVGWNDHGQCNVGGWGNITQVAAGVYHTVGLTSDGTVVAAGGSLKVGPEDDDTTIIVYDGQCDVGNWTDIVQITAGNWHTVGVKSDGTVVAVGANYNGQCDVSGWLDIIQVAGGWDHTVGLKSDGTVVAVGDNGFGQCDVGDWTGIVKVAASLRYTVGVKYDGTVVAAGWETELAKWNLGVTTEYTLTVSSVTGGSVTTPGEGVFLHNAGVLVRVVAKAEKGYRFVNWTGDVGVLFNVNSAITVITMRGDYSITANFEEKPPINWALISGIIAGVVIIGLVIFFLRRRRTS
jgi:hypothetical protein